MINNQVVPSIILSNPTLTNARLMANWTFYLDAPAPGGDIGEEQPNAEPDEVEEAMEQEQPTEGVQPPPTQDPSSSRRRRRSDHIPASNDDIMAALMQRIEIDEQRERNHQTQYTEMMGYFQQQQTQHAEMTAFMN